MLEFLHQQSDKKRKDIPPQHHPEASDARPPMDAEQLCAALQEFVARVTSPELRRVMQRHLEAALADINRSAAGEIIVDDSFFPILDLKGWLKREPDEVAVELAETAIFQQLKEQSEALRAHGADTGPQWTPPAQQLYRQYLTLRKQYGLPVEHDAKGIKLAQFLKEEGWKE